MNVATMLRQASAVIPADGAAADDGQLFKHHGWKSE
jgi:hypothetical protein